MEKRSTNSRGGSFSGLLRTIGFLSVLLFALGLAKKAGIQVSLAGADGLVTEESFLSASASAYGKEEGEDVLVIRPHTQREDEGGAYRPSRSYADMSRGSSSSSGSKLQVDDWIDKFSGTAVMQALNRGVPAGVSLAVGVAKLQSGSEINSWSDFVEQVVEPLAGLKHDSGLRSYFKYSANSEQWLRGLDRSGQYRGESLRGIVDRYRLGDFDEIVKEKLIAGPAVVDPEVERKAGEVAEKVAAGRRDRREAAGESAGSGRSVKIGKWETVYDEIVGREVAKEVARKKLKSGEYISEEDMSALVEETNVETETVLQNKLAFPGRSINRNHPDAARMLDVSEPANSQAREELYQRIMREKGRTDRKKPD